MSAADGFLDSNILVYLVAGDATKADRAQALLRDRPTISVQALNEFVSVARRKIKLTWPEIRLVLATVKAACRVVPITLETHEGAVTIAEQSGLNIYDALMVAAAAQAGCRTLLTEDLNAGQRIGTVTIRNPFL